MPESLIVGIVAGVLIVVISYGLARGFKLLPGDISRITIASLMVLITVSVMVILITLSNLGFVQILVVLLILSAAGAIVTELAVRDRLLPIPEGNKTDTKPSSVPIGGTGWGKRTRIARLSKRERRTGIFKKASSAVGSLVGDRHKERSGKLISESFNKIGAGELESAMADLQRLRDSETDPAILMRTYINLAWLHKNLGNRAGAIIELQHALEYARFTGNEKLSKDILKMIRDLAYQ